MKQITNYIKETTDNCHLRNLIIDVDEELRDLTLSGHGLGRKNQSHNGTEDINKEEIIKLVNRCDTFIVNKLLNNKIKINTGTEQFGIRKLSKSQNHQSFACVFEVTYFNKDTFEYDLRVVTINKEKYIFKFKPNTKFIVEIDKSGYLREVKE